jgi:hypothetical protein
MKTLISIILVFILITSCKKSEYVFQGEITAIDGSKCSAPCCGGWFFTTGGRQQKVQQFPSQIDFNPMRDTLPIRVEFDVESTTPVCDGSINVLTFKRIRKAR